MGKPLMTVIWDGGMLLTTDSYWVAVGLIEAGVKHVLSMPLTAFGEISLPHSWLDWKED